MEEFKTKNSSKEQGNTKMSKLQEVFSRVQETKRKQKTIRDAYKDALSVDSEYQHVLEKLEKYKQRKKEIEIDLQRQMGSDFDKLDKYKLNLKMDKEMLADISIGYVANGQKVEVKDKYENYYEPFFNVSFKKRK